MGSYVPEVIAPKDQNALAFDSLPASLPVAIIAENVDHDAIASRVIARLEELDESTFTDAVVWRDLCALTGTFRTFYGAQKAWSVWEKLRYSQQPSGFKPVPGTSEIVRANGQSSWILMAYTFECHGATARDCSGFVGLVPDAGTSEWKIWMLTTCLENLIGFPNPDKAAVATRAAQSLVHDCTNDHMNGHTNGDEGSNAPHQTGIRHDTLDCVVVGAGFSGLVVAGRLQAMGLKVLTVDKNTELGDNWKNRYDSARFHTTRDYSDFPLGRMFTADDPKYPGRLDLIQLYHRYVKFHSINVSCSSELKHASYDLPKRLWSLEVETSGTLTTMKAKHLVLAIGGLGAVPRIPNLRNKELYKGEIMHSFYYKSAHAWKGKTGIVVGSANTAHDVAEDMVDAGMASVTLVQRTPTPVFPIEWYQDLMDSYYTLTSDLEYSDRRTISLPVAVARLIGMEYYQGRMREDPEKLDTLARAGFAIERSGDMVKCAFGDGAGGHHTDVGGGARIIRGQIKVKSLASATGLTETGLEFSDGTHLDADVIVLCTGFHTNMRLEALKILGADMYDQLDDFWGIDGEGELRGAFKRMKQPGIWFMGGGAPWARFGSRFLALQIHADVVGKPLMTYTADQREA